MKARIVLTSMALTLLAIGLVSRAQELPGQSAADIAKVKDEMRLREQILARQFSEFENALLKLKDRLKRSGKKEDVLRRDFGESARTCQGRFHLGAVRADGRYAQD